ncbi:unnamed protein product [Closterium sp. NIES-65]|nr:unnamed protein product [Closterium sp. NIES-65]
MGDNRGAEEGKAEERPPLRLLVVGRKLLPTPSHRSRPHWGYVDAVCPHVEDIRAALEGGATGRGAARSSSRKSHTHLVYSLRWPEAAGEEEKAGGRQGQEEGEGAQAGVKEEAVCGKGNQTKSAGQAEGEKVETPQEAFNIEREASYVLQVKNPQAPSRLPYLARPSVRLQAFPPPLQHRLNGLRFAPADPPGFLDHPGCEVLLIGASDDLQREFGGEVQRHLAAGEGEGGEGGVGGGGEGELGGGEESGYGSGCEGDEWMGFVREGLGWQSEQLVKPLEEGEWA